MTECPWSGDWRDECPADQCLDCWDFLNDDVDAGPPPRPITTVPTGSYL